MASLCRFKSCNRKIIGWTALRRRALGQMPYGGASSSYAIRAEALRLVDVILEAHEIADVVQLLRLSSTRRL